MISTILGVILGVFLFGWLKPHFPKLRKLAGKLFMALCFALAPFWLLFMAHIVGHAVH